MKSSYTKRALAFWLAVAMVATSAPMAFATTSTSPTSTRTGTSDVGTPTPQAGLTAENQKLNDLTVGTEYTSASPIVSGGQGAYTMTAKEGTLPKWLTLTTDGKLTGTPTEVGTGTVTVIISDSTEGAALTKEIQITYNVKAKEVKVTAAIVQDKVYDATKNATVTSVTFGQDQLDSADYTATAEFTSPNVSESAQATVTVELTEQGKKKYSLGTATTTANAEITAADVTKLEISKQSFEKDTSVEEIQNKLKEIKAVGIGTDTEVAGTYVITNAEWKDDLPQAKSSVTKDNFINTVGTYKVTATFTPESKNYKAKEVTFDCDITGQTQMTLKFDQASVSKTYGDEKFTLAAKAEGASAYGEITYTSSDPTVAEVDSKTGEVTIKSAGKTTITANMQGTQTTTAASASYELTVNQATHQGVVVEDSVFANQAKSYIFDLPQEVRELPGVTYGQVEKSGDLISSASVENNKLTVNVTSQSADASGTVTIPASSTNYEKFNLVYKLKAVSKTDVSSKITFADKTEYYTGKAIQLSAPSISGIAASGQYKWTYTWSKDGTQTTSSGSETMPSFTEVGTYRVTATYEDDANLGRKTATLTIKPAAVKSTITVTATQMSSSKDDNYKYWDLEKRSWGDGYLNLRADADDYLVRQSVNGDRYYWIGLDITPKINDQSCKVEDLYVSDSGKSDKWKRMGSLSNKECSIGDFYLEGISGSNFYLWFDTDGDSDNSDTIYLATDSKGSNKFELYVDFNSYSGSSSSSSGSSSSDTSKVDGDRVSTTTVDKTPSVKNGSATVTFSSSALSDALDENKKEAKREDADKTYIELDVKTSKSVDDTTITVPRSSLDKIADEDTGLKLTTNQGTVTFDYRALAEIYDACDKTNIEFYLEEEDDDQYVLLIKDGSSDVIDLGRGSVEVTFDYKLKSGEKSSDVKVYRIGNGDKTWLATYGGSTVYGAADVYAAAPTYVTDMKADYSSSKKKVTFTTDALGTFLITTDTLKTGSGSTTTTPTYNAFVDVPSSRWSATYINKLASLGIINGTGGGYFEPTLYVTREEFVKMLAGVAGANVTGYTSSRFPDVPLSRWSAPYIAWAADRGITTGTDGGNFAPTMRITREEMAAMIYRYVQSSGKTLPAKNAPVIFADANLISGWAQTPVSVMQQAGIIDGNVTNGRYTFDPKVSASREECAKMLAVLYDLVR